MSKKNSSNNNAPVVVLVRTRFPENVGMAARACANMGAAELILVDPERWDMDKAAPLATGQGLAVLQSLRIVPTLREALEGCTHAFGTTARTGGWRQGVMPPARAADEICAVARTGGRVALVFGPEDRGLENGEVAICTRLVTIPTAPEQPSLNLAQAVLIVLYEWFTARLEHAYHPDRRPKKRGASRAATLEEQEMLFAALRHTLTLAEFLPEDNPDWFMQPLRRFFCRAGLQRHEFDLFMGVCRRFDRLAEKAFPKV